MKFLIAVAAFLCLSYSMLGQTRISTRSKLILPPNYDASRSYPVLVLMPYTGGSAHDYIRKYFGEAKINRDTLSLNQQFAQFLEYYNTEYQSNREFMLLVPDGNGSRRDHDWRGFAACIERYEHRVRKDLDYYDDKYNLDRSRVYISGVSLGGDLSWALSIRNTDLFQGAIVVGSRCSYPPKKELDTLAEKGFRYFLAMGMQEAETRLAGMQYARRFLDSARVDYIYREMPGLAHNRAPLWLFLEAVDVVMFGERKATAAKPSAASALVGQLEGEHIGQLETNKYRMAQDQGLIARGDGLLMPTETFSNEQQSLQFSRAGEDLIWLQMEGLPKLKMRVTKKEDGQVHLEIFEHSTSSYKYQGIVFDTDLPKVHGVLELNEEFSFLSLDFERLYAKDHNRRTTYSLFLEIPNLVIPR